MAKDQTLVLYACCIPVQGARRSLLCDLQRKKYYFIPNSLYNILTNDKGKSLQQLREAYGDQTAVLDQYLTFLLDNDLGFLTDEPELFPQLEMKWHFPNKITNAIIDTGASSAHNYKNIIGQLGMLGCISIQFRYFDKFSAEDFMELLRFTKQARFRSLELLMPYYEDNIEADIHSMAAINKRLASIVVHGAPFELQKYNSKEKISVIYIKEKIDSAAHCGFVHPSHFRTETVFFTEAVNFNSCLNRKISVDENGDIRNCPAHKNSYGNAAETKLTTALEQPAFTAPWLITKDQVNVCRDCEFRYICTDCRVFTSGNDPLGKPAKCNYDPYNATWLTIEDNPQSSEYRKLKTEFVNDKNLVL